MKMRHTHYLKPLRDLQGFKFNWQGEEGKVQGMRKIRKGMRKIRKGTRKIRKGKREEGNSEFIWDLD